MTYVMSDIHGCYSRYLKLLEMAEFCDNDTLYILGDVIDRGPESIRLLTDMSMRTNVLPILGNHEYMMNTIMPGLMSDIEDENLDKLDSDWMRGYMHWTEDGGDSTIAQFKALSREDQEGVMEYLDEFLPYELVKVEGKKYLLVHAGLQNYVPGKPLDDYRIDQFLYYVPDRDFAIPGITVVCGHVPTFVTDPKMDGKIIHDPGVIRIDCGAAAGRKLGMLCLDTGEEFYA